MARKLPAQPEVNIGLVGHVITVKPPSLKPYPGFGPTPTPKNVSEASPSNSVMLTRRSTKTTAASTTPRASDRMAAMTLKVSWNVWCPS